MSIRHAKCKMKQTTDTKYILQLHPNNIDCQVKCQSPDNSPYLHSNFAAISSISHLAVLFNTVFKATFH